MRAGPLLRIMDCEAGLPQDDAQTSDLLHSLVSLPCQHEEQQPLSAGSV